MAPDAPADGSGPRREALLLDAMLGKLARYLRMCGYDAAYALDRGVEDDDDLLALAAAERRRIVTRDEHLAARTTDGVLLTTRAVTDQLRELSATGFDISLTTPARCGRCNAPLERLAVDADRPAYVPDDAAPVWRCTECGQHFWKGSHWADVGRRVSDI